MVRTHKYSPILGVLALVEQAKFLLPISPDKWPEEVLMTSVKTLEMTLHYSELPANAGRMTASFL